MTAKPEISVLLVDDEESYREALARRLSRRGLNVAQEADGEAALARLGAEAPDVVLLDVKMPGLDGLEVLRRIKKARPLTEVILLTGHAHLETSITGLERGAFDYLLKPVPLEELVEKIHDAWEKKSVQERKIRAVQADGVKP
ncbi:MAG: response regulator [Desulfarculus sp.]|nr:response regulator [Pseudomonadota bacterium]MBV1715533.1 response regulator [Desulfarculus sp.]MBU4574303.1 response regulator [Pseudomonadota bacterium]MBU4599469.1 response regulator [Pseudomonadota bacterium]MBV1740296.1 response regulator [Desulfarculus sp.]